MLVGHPEISSNVAEERQELQTLLQSETFKKAPNLVRFLEYVAEQHFSGNTDHIKEYNIAVEALHRPEQFDPQSDTIVRTTAHALRKKLDLYYATEGNDHQVQIQLPVGKYVLQFVRKHQEAAEDQEEVVLARPMADFPKHTPLPTANGRWSVLWIFGIACAVLVVAAAIYFTNRKPKVRMASVGIAAASLNGAHGQIMRIRFGKNDGPDPYLDAAGQPWITEKYCQGGTAFAHAGHEIQGTDDPAIFQQGREGKFQCKIPVPPGKYQILFLFADTAGDREAARQVDLTINTRRTDALDIVDEAGGDDVAIGKLYTGIVPMNDGTIHLDFTSDGSFVNAIEVTPTDAEGGQVQRMVAGPEVFRDNQGNTWLPERFFQGGRRTFHPDGLPKIPNSKLFEWERYGHFHYLIPAVAGKEYKIRLYFSEGWFGVGNGGPGGIGSRVFDVYCNGTTLLKDFDILSVERDGAAVTTFDHVKPTAHGMLDISFTPIKNYPLINAIEVEPEN